MEFPESIFGYVVHSLATLLDNLFLSSKKLFLLCMIVCGL